jgi:hypothetical protein
MKRLFSFLIIIAAAAVCSVVACAQSSSQIDDEDFQSWNDIQVTHPLNKNVDLLIQTTFRFTQNLTRFNEGRIGGGLAFKLNKSVAVSPTYTYIESRNSSGAFRTEHRYSLRGTFKFPTKNFGLSHRSIYEYRVRSSGNSWRYRPSLTFEKALPAGIISKAKIFVTEEPFYISTTGKFSRNRFSIGINKTVNSHLSLDVYYLRQNDGFSHPGDLNVLGTSWKIHL